MGKREPSSRSARWLKLAGFALVAAVAVAFLVPYYMGRSAVAIVYAGGTAAAPRVIASAVLPDRASAQRDVRLHRARQELLVFGPDEDEPIGTIRVPGTASPVGHHGGRLWMKTQQLPFLVDVERGRVAMNTAAIEGRHAPLSNGFKISAPNHSDFVRDFNPSSGDVGIQADNGLHYVLSMDGALLPWDDFVAAHPRDDELICRGGRKRVCGTRDCVKLVPDPAGGERLSMPSAASAQAFFGAELPDVGCVPRVGPDGPFAVVHQSRPGRGMPKDRITAVAADGESRWSVTLGDLFGDRKLRSHTVGVGEDAVVVGAVVPDWARGATILVASVAADGTIRSSASPRGGSASHE